MQLAIMQPYFFPYLGYWQLMNSVNRFVVYDDVQYIKRGWINRNRILMGDRPGYITIPLCDASQNRSICELKLARDAVWRTKLLKTIVQNYRRAKHFDESFQIISSVITCPADDLADFLFYQLQNISNAIGISTEIVRTSRTYGNQDLHGQLRVLDICQREHASTYVNAPGGRLLYHAKSFADLNINLRFIEPCLPTYQQCRPGFVAGLSIIDAMMAVGPKGLAPMLAASKLSE